MRGVLLLALVAGWLPACTNLRAPRVQTGPDALLTVDGLHKVDHVPLGDLYMKPDYRVGTYRAFALGDTLVTFQRGSRVLDEEQVAELKRRFDGIAREVIVSGGTPYAREPGPCIAEVNLALVDVDLLDPKGLSGSRTAVVDSLGAATLVLEIRDGHTGEPLLRYGRRRRLEGGYAHGADPATGTALSLALQRFASDFQRDFQRSLPHVEADRPPITCEQRAGLLPPVAAEPPDAAEPTE
jgi:hypothetical protein